MTNGEQGRLLELKAENRRLRQELKDLTRSVRLLIKHSTVISEELRKLSDAMDERAR